MHSFLRWSTPAAALAALATTSSAQFDPHTFKELVPGTQVPLADRDVRFDGDQTNSAVRAAIARARTAPVEFARAEALARLRAAVPGVAVDEHEIFGTPHFVRSTVAFLTRPVEGGADAAEMVVRDFLDAHRGLFEASPGELLRTVPTRDAFTRHNGMRHLTWKQEKDGVPIVGCELRANVTRDGELVNVSSTLLQRPDGDFVTSPMRLTDREALAVAAANIGVTFATFPEPMSAREGAAQKSVWSSVPELRSDEPTTSELVYFPKTRDDVRAAWLVVLPELGIGNTYEVTIDATTGDVLKRQNRLLFAMGGTQPITMRVFTQESPAPGTPGPATPNGTQFPTVPQQLVTVNAAEVTAFSPEHWIADGGNETLGNNCDAHLDLDANNSPDLPRPQGVPFRTFDFNVDTTQAPTNASYRNGAVTQLFYLTNRYHDKLYSLGFDEAAKNFQTTNFSGQGVGGDAVQADAQDGSGTNNANFGTTGTDGSSGRMQMYVFTGPTPDRDGDLDADIVYHELTHGLSIRLLDGAAFGEQAGGMGEGWGDFFGLCLNSQPGEDPSGTYTTGGWTTNQLGGLVDNYYFGIRRFPYSTDLNKAPQTYADTDPAQQNYPPAVPRSPVIGNTADQVHNVGEVWCVTLWECRANLIAAQGFAGNDTIMQLVVDGLKLAPGTPNFLQARDAILQSDLVASGGANLSALWAGFAKRGMGASATSPSGSTTTGIVEAFDQPNTILFAYPNGKPSTLAPGVATTFQVEIVGLGTATPTPGSGTLSYSVNGGGFTTIAMTQTSPNHYDATIPPQSCLAVVRYYVTTATNAGDRSDPPTAPAAFNSALVATGTADVYADDFQTDQGWAGVVLGATSGQWQRGVPVNDPAWDYDPTGDADGSGQCWLTQNALGNTDVDGGAVQLTSRVFDFSSTLAKIEYEYYLFLTVEDGADRLLVEINSNNGVGAWTTIAVHDSNGDTTWRHHEVTATAVQALGVTLTANTRVRFTANDGGTASITEAGVDGFRVSTAVCSAAITPYCFGDGTGTACPCGNNGAANAGCTNSLGFGATLAASGSASVAGDTIVLTGTNMPNAAALYFQGTNQDAGGAGVVFGDGLRCTSGTVIRLGTKTNASGASSYPEVGDLSVSVRGLVPAIGGQRYYQVWYRNAAAFCTVSTFNLSNGVGIGWIP